MMARPGLEPGTPRFSDTSGGRAKGARLQHFSERAWGLDAGGFLRFPVGLGHERGGRGLNPRGPLQEDPGGAERYVAHGLSSGSLSMETRMSAPGSCHCNDPAARAASGPKRAALGASRRREQAAWIRSAAFSRPTSARRPWAMTLGRGLAGRISQQVLEVFVPAGCRQPTVERACEIAQRSHAARLLSSRFTGHTGTCGPQIPRRKGPSPAKRALRRAKDSLSCGAVAGAWGLLCARVCGCQCRGRNRAGRGVRRGPWPARYLTAI